MLITLLSGAMQIRVFAGHTCSQIHSLIALDKALFPTKKYLYFSYFLTKRYVVGTH